MNDILIVTGTCGVGKSAVCCGWANRRQGASIECDMFRTWIRNRELRQAEGYQEQLLAKHASALAEDYLKMGLGVAIDNVWTPKGLALLHDRLHAKGTVRTFWLNCTSNENHQRDEQRSGTGVMGVRVDELQRELEGMNWCEYVVKLDTSGQSLDETLDQIDESFKTS
jgi:hypothetical protein